MKDEDYIGLEVVALEDMREFMGAKLELIKGNTYTILSSYKGRTGARVHRIKVETGIRRLLMASRFTTPFTVPYLKKLFKI